MGVFRVPVEIGDLDGTRFERIEALVDTGASYTMLPASILHGLGIAPYRTLSFTLADGSAKEYELGQAMVRINGDSAPTIVVFGDRRHACSTSRLICPRGIGTQSQSTRRTIGNYRRIPVA